MEGTGRRRAFIECHKFGTILSIPDYFDLNGLLDLQLREHLGILLAGLHVLPIDRHEDIAPQDPRFSLNGHIQFAGTEPDRLGRAPIFHIDDEQPTHKGKCNQIPHFVGHKFPFDAQPGPDHSAIRPQLSHDGLDGIDRNGEPDVLRSHQDC